MLKLEGLRRAIEMMGKADDGTGLAPLESIDVVPLPNSDDMEIRMWIKEREPAPEEYGTEIENWLRQETIPLPARAYLRARSDPGAYLRDIALKMRHARALSPYSKLCLRAEELPRLIHQRKFADAVELAKDVWVELEAMNRPRLATCAKKA